MSVRSGLVESFVRYATQGDVDHALAMVHRLLSQGVAPGAVAADVVMPAQAWVGERWLAGALTVVEEHAASAVAETVLNLLFPDAPATLDGADVLVACSEGEWHVLPCRLVADVLGAAGHRARSLGGSMSAVELGARLERRAPGAVLVSCTLSWGLGGAARTVGAARRAGVPTIVGGAAFGSDGRYAHGVGADAWAPDPWAAEALVRSWVHERPPDPSTRPPPEPRPGVLAVELRGLEITARLVDRWRLDVPEPAWGDPLLRILAAAARNVAQMVESAMVASDGGVLAEGLRWQAAALARDGLSLDPAPSAMEVLCALDWSPWADGVVDEAAALLVDP